MMSARSKGSGMLGSSTPQKGRSTGASSGGNVWARLDRHLRRQDTGNRHCHEPLLPMKNNCLMFSVIRFNVFLCSDDRIFTRLLWLQFIQRASMLEWLLFLFVWVNSSLNIQWVLCICLGGGQPLCSLLPFMTPNNTVFSYILQDMRVIVSVYGAALEGIVKSWHNHFYPPCCNSPYLYYRLLCLTSVLWHGTVLLFVCYFIKDNKINFHHDLNWELRRKWCVRKVFLKP